MSLNSSPKFNSTAFKSNAKEALKSEGLKLALDRTTGLLKKRRAQAIADFPDYEATRALAAKIKDHTLEHWGYYLEQFERNALANGAQVYWAKDAKEANSIITKLCLEAEAKKVTRVKSMLGEEIGLPAALEQAGIESIETDLAEHIIQLANEPPSHIVMPAMHKTREQVAALFKQKHPQNKNKALDDSSIEALVKSARVALRQEFAQADVGISGANMLVAQTGSVITVTNEGNAELCCEVPPVHIVAAGIEKVVPDLDSAQVLLRLLARAAIGTPTTQYTSFYTGSARQDERAHDPKRAAQTMHIVLVDNARSKLYASPYRAMLRCIRCGACMNHCPVYAQIGGHPYGATYPGPMGAILTPIMQELGRAKDLPQACTLNGRCQDVCPVKIPLKELMRDLRDDLHQQGYTPKAMALGLKLWSYLARFARLYQSMTSLGQALLAFVSSTSGAQQAMIKRIPLMGAWFNSRHMLRPSRNSFMDQYKQSQQKSTKSQNSQSNKDKA